MIPQENTPGNERTIFKTPGENIDVIARIFFTLFSTLLPARR